MRDVKDLITVTGAPASWKLGALSRRIAKSLRAGRFIGREAAVVLSISCVSARKMAALNFKYRRKRSPTDVLSFENVQALKLRPRPKRMVFLGDVVLCPEVAGRQARDQGHSARLEAAVLLAHGVLHLLGFDHERSRAAEKRMALAERRLLRRAGLKAAGLVARGVLQNVHG